MSRPEGALEYSAYGHGVRRPVRNVCVCQVAGVVAIMMAEPGHREAQAIFVAAFGNIVEIVVRVHRAFGSASVGGIGVEDVAIFVFVEDAEGNVVLHGGPDVAGGDLHVEGAAEAILHN